MATAREHVGFWARGFQPSPHSNAAVHYPGTSVILSDNAALYFEGGVGDGVGMGWGGEGVGGGM